MEKCDCKGYKSCLCNKKLTIFRDLTEEEFNKLATGMACFHFNKGEYICYEGEKLSKLFLVSRGSVKISKLTKGGKEQIMHIFSVGDYFGETSLFNNEGGISFNAIALNDVIVCAIDKYEVDSVLEENPGIAMVVLKSLTSRLKETEEFAHKLATNDVRVRIAYMLKEFRRKYGKVENGEIFIDLPINREDMANYCGITRETMSRKLSIFEHEGLIEIRGNKSLIIKDIEKIRKIIS
ncbi:Crp/Fnr family transcriptional regulator [Clostridium sp. LIBA-8841]|uniref:Crp/Fnr family transcriptional regulator n=1 Tax=Clostridium sp. LIBA-8841 TaxID=2987530 RepID=UPI002AC6A462|nr:Crp/Fnr family transcriptional regulator [Clostridium sp. LIBA-8841]MDZ5253397.1 Crp/Fnr family transcriptional regulator [Clostridium sp. LIBA-8841]